METRVKIEPQASPENSDVIGANYEDQNGGNFFESEADSEFDGKGARNVFGIDETRALLQIWGEKDIQDVLRTTKHNRAIYERIQARMVALGYNRWTARQLHDKCKNLSMDYRRVKRQGITSGGNGSGRLVFKFYNELDRILGQQTETCSSSGEDYQGERTVDSATSVEDNQIEENSHGYTSPENGKLSYTEPEVPAARIDDSRYTDSPSYMYMQDDARKLQSRAKLQIRWSDAETMDLLNIWGRDHFQTLLKVTHHNKPIYQEIEVMMNALGHTRSAKQIHEKCKNLSVEYRRARRTGGDNTSRRFMFKFYDKLDKILGHEMESSPSGQESSQASVSGMEDLGDDSSGSPYPVSVTTVVRNTEEAEQPNPHESIEDCSPHAMPANISTSADGAPTSSPVPSHQAWLGSETMALLEVWGRKSIQDCIYNGKHNRRIFQNIQRIMQERGYCRTVEQLQDKCKSLAKEYRKVKQMSTDDSGRRAMCRFYDELDSILGRFAPSESGTKQTKRPHSDTICAEKGNSPFQPSLPNGNVTMMNGTGVKRRRMEDSESESDGGNCEMISPRPKTSSVRIVPGRRFFALKAAGCVFQSESWQPRGETLYQPLQFEVLVNATNIEQVSFSEGLAFVGNEAGAYVRTESGHMIHLWRHDNEQRKLYVSRSFLFTNYQMYSEVREVLEQL
ncbi:uncharacterized protein LOC118431733 [Branchiostoma floridae]|uniref:phosphoribosylaminoimidazolesuccinocarboxamide synthase n=1 Tax=Branchiostoma floridae TaxID=7739 RepID=A0A9J7NC19_BRAFL|nr:uncharacterized protein LOC118431733 [Branchiostoma floridae]XP_035698916.1 uncharacterized protein LOC118431733 [Branchiostoma floridae]